MPPTSDQIRQQRDARHRTNEQLETEVAERTAELVARSQELEAVNIRLREIDTNRAQFFADISHESRTPLTVLRCQAEVTLRRRDTDTDPEPLRETLETIVRKAAQMGRLVEGMLFLARSKGIVLAPQQPIEPVSVRGDADRLRHAGEVCIENVPFKGASVIFDLLLSTETS